VVRPLLPRNSVSAPVNVRTRPSQSKLQRGPSVENVKEGYAALRVPRNGSDVRKAFARPPPLPRGARIVIHPRLPRNLVSAPVATHDPLQRHKGGRAGFQEDPLSATE
jgi:hypothetical protein